MALPNFLIYYWSANIRSILHWFHSCRLDNHPSWLRIESASCNNSSLAALLCLPYTFSLIKYSNNIIVKNSLKIWTQFLRHFGLHNTPLSSPIHSNPLFYPSVLDSAYALWRDLGLVSIGDLYSNGVFTSFEQLTSQFNIPKSHFFRYLQVRDFVRKRMANFPNKPVPSDLDTILSVDPCTKGSISKLMNIIVHLQTVSDNLRIVWSQDIGTDINAETWKLVLNRVNSSSLCARHKLIQCKVVHRAHWSKSRLARINPSIDPECDRCHSGSATLIHMFWSCPALSSFWQQIFNSLSAIISFDIPLCPLTGLFGIFLPGHSLPSHTSDFVAFLTLLARRLILLNWKSSHPPSHTHWIRDVLYFMKLEKIRYSLHRPSTIFDNLWQPVREHVQSLQLDPVLWD